MAVTYRCSECKKDVTKDYSIFYHRIWCNECLKDKKILAKAKEIAKQEKEFLEGVSEE